MLILSEEKGYAKPIIRDKNAPHLVLVPPQVVLQLNQTEVEVNCSVFSDQPTSIQWLILSSR